MMVPIKDIVVPSGRRHFAKRVQEMKESVSRYGQLHPIILVERNGSLELCCGLHRLAACRELGHTEIRADIKSLDEADRKGVELDENLIRGTLTPRERGAALRLRKALYEARHPETRKGGDRKSAEKIKHQNLVSDPPVPSFAASMASLAPGHSATNVANYIQIARDIPDDVAQVLSGTAAERKVGEMLALSKLSKEKQRELAPRLAAGASITNKRAHSVSEKAPRVRAKAPNIDADMRALEEITASVRRARGAWGDLYLQWSHKQRTDVGFALREAPETKRLFKELIDHLDSMPDLRSKAEAEFAAAAPRKLSVVK